MKENKLTPGSNVRWVSSRMMLPEHVEAIRVHEQEIRKKKRPELSEEQLYEVDWKLRMSRDYTTGIEILIFGEHEDHKIKGIVDKIDLQLMRVKIELEDGQFEWVDIGDMLSVECL